MAALELGLEENFDNTGDGQLRVPGFVYDYRFELDDLKRFRHGANDFQQAPRLTAREVAMLGVMNALTDKADWHLKVFDEEIVGRWKEEARAVPLISDKAWDWCMAELRDKATRFEKTGRVQVLDAASRISKSDRRVPRSLIQDLRDAVSPLLNRPNAEKDWHPGSDDKVLNLVHPSLFPLVYGKTKVLMKGGKVPLDFADAGAFDGAETAPPIPVSRQRFRPGLGMNVQRDTWSQKFQWLPCEVEFTEDAGTDVQISSYINNLHPSHHAAYTAIEKIISLSIAPWNEVLVAAYRGRTPPRILTYGAQFTPDLPEWHEDLFEIQRNQESDPTAYEEARKMVLKYIGQPETADDSADEEDLTEESDEEPEFSIEDYGLSGVVDEFYKQKIRKVVHPEPGVSFSFEQWKVGLTSDAIIQRNGFYGSSRPDHVYYPLRIQDSFRDEGLQVIVKLASIELTPEKPRYDGGNWHIEGLLNEHIAATAIYYYDVDNLTESKISFRTAADLDSMDFHYEQDDHAPIAEIFGISSGKLRQEPAIQNLGSVTTPEGRLLVFPNTLQHKVEPFELIDQTRPGHRRYLVLWLVDPHYRICSTRNVPPQQESWRAAAETESAPDSDDSDSETMGSEADDDWMSLEEAKRLRLELMAERTRAMEDVERATEEYNFCEH
ncbi:hypothetical protein J7T55_013021 [Diaporthe amygdali]|uniref:uncharacterized protein n=1 Tax=Phomopsis amygdali TaxID=1214568 RepID=UPI0022FE7A5E|nr:uncharacterized protein J7T55_013021 [Diaporthe amygdali]KAJ0118767.1 hypothetical protein J7T55_013021 [Diaporthe amygdali]